ncbi:MAG: flap endonuclease-1 [Candidatus Woesearchaeota archaeon]
MGTKLKEITACRQITIEDLKGKNLVVDAHNILYQFLTTIRMNDGSLLMDSNGSVTSHLNGLFNRSLSLMQKGLNLAFVFDGRPPELKDKERERRKGLKEDAAKDYEKAKQEGDIEGMKKYSSRMSRLTPEMIEEAKKLISALGMPVIDAPSEGEAQAAHIVKRGEAYAEISQDFDCLMFGVPRLVRNLTITERRRMPGKASFSGVRPEMIDLKENLDSLGISQDQLIALCLLVGTDYNYGGVKGIGPKKALKMIKGNDDDFDSLFKEVGWSDHSDIPWKQVYDTITGMPVTDDYNMEWKAPDRDKLMELLVDGHDFSEKRVSDSLSKLEKEKSDKSQKGLNQFFG